MMFPKQRPFRSRRYLDWVKSQPSVISGLPADDPHHIKVKGYGGTKTSDLWAIPLTRAEHDELHRGVEAWEEKHGSQWKFAAETIERAVSAGVLRIR